MSETFTPGPWVCIPSLRAGTYMIVAQQGPIDVCPAIAHGLTDARLIAAAPDLFEALLSARFQLEQYELERTGELYHSPKINAALRRARGDAS